MISGSCLCGSARYDITGEISDIVHCHCETCRKAHGSAFSSVAMVPLENFSIKHDEPLGSYESSPGKTRYFCSKCGTQLYAHRGDKDHVMLRLGSLDSEISSSEFAHIWLSEKADWYSLHTDIKEFDVGMQSA